MRCYMCDGRGMRYDGFQNLYRTCEKCGGSGKAEPLTNDEWRRTCSTEEFAEWLFELGCDFGFCNHEVRCKDCANPWKCMSEPKYIVDWLKEKHE